MSKVTRWDGPPPYLGILEQVSVVWIRTSIIAILIIGFALWIGATTAVSGIKDAKGALEEACAASEKVATVAANLPHYVGKIVSDELNSAIIDLLQASRKALELLLTAMTSVVRYFLEIVNSIIKFLFQFIIGGLLAVVTDFTNAAQQTLNNALGGIADQIQSDLNASVSPVNSILGRINNIIRNFNRDWGTSFSTINTVTINFDVSRIRNFRVPNTVADTLSNLSGRLPNLDSLVNNIDNTIAGPIQTLTSQMNSTFSNINPPTVDIAIPQVGAVEYCDKLNIGFLDELGDEILWAMRVGLGILAAIALIIWLSHAFLLWLIWRLELKGNSLAGKFWSQGHAKPPAISAVGAHAITGKEGAQEPVASTSHSPAPENAIIPLTRHNILALDNPFSTWTAATVLSLIPFIHPSEVTRDRLAWFFAYIFSIHPLVCFGIGLFGVLALSLQLILINIVRRRIDRELGKLIDDVVDLGIDTTINRDLNGWISTAVGAFGSLWTSATTTLRSGITQTFQGTPLQTPMGDLAQTITNDNQVASSISNAQNYLQQNLRLVVPRIDPKVFALSNATLDEISDTLARAAIGGNGNQGVFGLIFDRYTKLLKNLMTLFGCLLAIWGVVVVMALGILLVDIIRHRGPAKGGQASTQPGMSEKEKPVVERDIEAAGGETPAPVNTESDAEHSASATGNDPPVAGDSTQREKKGLRRLLPLLSHKERESSKVF
ncbi:SubName: Full=Related to plasma membrane fusion protein PRM1-Laccaria bicolor {ECO:0000313/EMBL:CCA66450.1} [Serendipita indica DSM 11827]|nr:SubName: Full=Related to plasma membrane fusion protein PRM1-Laccaria bicolor {ECO:0000313/EMBL:CCA66450.1} [Serendipita indica DSM 11827]